MDYLPIPVAGGVQVPVNSGGINSVVGSVGGVFCLAAFEVGFGAT
jgi:hypothetical protein